MTRLPTRSARRKRISIMNRLAKPVKRRGYVPILAKITNAARELHTFYFDYVTMRCLYEGASIVFAMDIFAPTNGVAEIV